VGEWPEDDDDGGRWAVAVARQMWHVLEPVHAVTYFAPECHDRYRALGLKGFWMGYFASRAAALGEASPELVTATFFNFHPAMVHRALPEAWTVAGPQAVLAARVEGSAAALHRLLAQAPLVENPDDGRPLAEAVDLAEMAAAACDLAGRPLFAAMRSVEPPPDALGRLWHAATSLREHRGDGHVAACLANGLDGLDAHVSFAAAGAVPRGVLQPNRGWSDEDWARSEQRLQARGWLDDHRLITPAGRAGRREVEDLTDRLGAGPWEALGSQRSAHLLDLLAPLARAVVDAEAIPAVNPMGVPTTSTTAPGPSL